jgi:hypothetical protein
LSSTTKIVVVAVGGVVTGGSVGGKLFVITDTDDVGIGKICEEGTLISVSSVSVGGGKKSGLVLFDFTAGGEGKIVCIESTVFFVVKHFINFDLLIGFDKTIAIKFGDDFGEDGGVVVVVVEIISCKIVRKSCCCCARCVLFLQTDRMSTILNSIVL